MKPSAALLVACALSASILTGCGAAMRDSDIRAADRGALIHRTLREYHVIYSANRGPVGYLKVYDVADAGRPPVRMSWVLDRDFNEVGRVDDFGNAYSYQVYKPGAMPEPDVPLREREMPVDSIGRNAMRMLGIDPSTDDVTFPLAKDGDIR